MEKNPREMSNEALLRAVPAKSGIFWQLPPKKADETRVDREKPEVHNYDKK